MRENNFKDCQHFMKSILSDMYRQHSYLLKSEVLDEFQKEEIKLVLSEKADWVACKSSLHKLSQYLYKHHGKQAVILIDEYDSPILAAYQNGYFKEMIEFMKTFLGAALKTNNALYKGVLTGILRVAKESIFSDLNNPGIYTTLQHDFADKFGFTESETRQLLQHFRLDDQFEMVKMWYDGYTFGDTHNLYNPWSISGYIGQHQEGFKPHWVNTSSDTLIKERILERDADDIRNDVEQLLLGNSIAKPIEQNIVFADFEREGELLWSMLLFSGYLIPVGERSGNIYELSIPNYEIKILFQKIIRSWLQVGMNIRTAQLFQMVESLTHNRLADFEKHFREVMGDTLSYFDMDKEPERVWQVYLLGLLSIAGEGYIIKSNRESGAGRYDILMLPKDKTKYRVVIEIKAMHKKASKKQINANLDEALNQIEKNEYYRELIAHQIEKRIEIAIVFVGKRLFLKANP